MSRMDDYFEKYMIEHGERSYIRKKNIKKYTIILGILALLCIATNPLTRIRDAYVEKFTNYASQEKSSLKETLNLDSNKNIKEESYTSKYPAPIKGTVTNPYGNGHTGIDIQGEHRTDITCIEDGTVTFAGVQSGYGNCVEIKHFDENGNVFYSFYAHLYEIDVKKDEEVKKFQVIGKEGGQPGVDANAGNSTGHHLHFEIRKASGYGNDVNPTGYIF